tara:strand:+ start:196 stop:1464 length:1269 start_codon:yes stop_codon:yes gene_type:complete
MGGGLLQLVAYGAQDVYLTGNPQITFFKVVYRRHTNFALESIQQTFNGSVGYGQRVTATISRNGDLISRAYLVIKTKDTKLVPYYGLKVIKHAEVEIGGQRIDKHYSDWMYIWNELSMPVAKKEGYYNMVGGKGGDELVGLSLYVPLEFWFCRNIGLALPLIGLQYHEVKINIQFEEGDLVANSSTPATDLSASLWVDYIYLDTDERRKFAQSSHEYLIEQLQFTGRESATNKIKLNFNHPVKELIWVVHDTDLVAEDWFNYTTSVSYGSTVVRSAITAKNSADSTAGNDIVSDFPYSTYVTSMGPGAQTNPVKQAKLILNGNDRFHARDGRYFNIVQPYQHHENVPNNAGINVYSFALKPEEHQPSGSLNMSRIDTAVLDLQYVDGYKAKNSSSEKQVSIFAVNYNVLRILSGMGGIAYSN